MSNPTWSDVRTFVGQQLEYIRAQIDATDDEDQIDWMETRATNFHVWKKFKHPLGWDDDEEDPMQKLARIVHSSPNRLDEGLPRANPPSITVNDFIDRFYKMGTATSKLEIRSPFYRYGNSAAITQTVITEAHRLLGRDRPLAERISDIKSAIRAEVDSAHIQIIPVAKGRDHTPSITCWTSLGAVMPRTAASQLGLTTTQRQGLALTRTLKAQRHDDSRAPWTTVEFEIANFHMVAKHQRRPDDWSLASTGIPLNTAGLVPDTYAWADELFSLQFQSWQVQLAHILGFLFSKILPRVFWPGELKKTPNDPVNIELRSLTMHDMPRSIDIVRTLPWMERANVKGLTEKAWIHEDSPLRKQLAAGRTELSGDWGNKHSSKGLGSVNLVRFGVCVGKGAALTNGPRVGRHLFQRSQDDLKGWHRELAHAMSTRGDGAYTLCTKIFGDSGVRFLVDQGQFPDLVEALRQKRTASSSGSTLDDRVPRRGRSTY
ncbi:hypothetical protein LXA43DRAFT_1068983 [Ganoderma leucocontextum]|nr:hypothetical protein LXA43DRAFT_1068983 [Ganoderma leucocontextum]